MAVGDGDHGAFQVGVGEADGLPHGTGGGPVHSFLDRVALHFSSKKNPAPLQGAGEAFPYGRLKRPAPRRHDEVTAKQQNEAQAEHLLRVLHRTFEFTFLGVEVKAGKAKGR